jgi:pyridoxamine 5'-phosphate oxidase
MYFKTKPVYKCYNHINLFNMELQDLRINYGKGSIHDRNLPDQPMEWFAEWLGQAIQASAFEANAMVLSTVAENGYPSSRVVLLKGFDERGFVFFTNYESRKGKQLDSNPQAALLFFWPEMERQVRIEGVVHKAEEELSDEYFYSRPLESRVSAAVSPQSEVVSSREQLEIMHNAFLNSNPDGRFERPQHWGGYRLDPRLIEFWQGRKNRLHDRIQYEREGFNWKRTRLAP